ncbi:ABC transporter permease [Niallia sp. 01092]|uniref:ABC transporter permease n=1 Tax=unclassified Niallia TaxID=2837522 RepID=UPI003FD08FFF
MIGLIHNELIKTFEKKMSWIFAIVLIVALIGAGLLVQRTSDKQKGDTWQESVQMEIKDLQEQQKKAPDQYQKEDIAGQIMQKQWNLKENVNPYPTNWSFMNDWVIGLKALVTLFVVIMCAGNISSEYSDGTIKQLLIRPHRRWAILLSKYISMLIYALFLLVVLLVFGYIVGIIFFGTGNFVDKIGAYTEVGMAAVSGGSHFFKIFAYYLPGLLMIITMAFMLSTLFKNQAVAVGVGIFVLFSSSTIGGLIVGYAKKYTWTKALIFPHLDQTIFVMQDKILENITMPMSLGILCVYYVIFMVITFLFFQKRDISI